MSTLNGASITHASMYIPRAGRWFATVRVVSALELAEGARATIAIGNATMIGAVESGGARDGRAAYVVVGGRRGWSRTVAAKGYANDAGVKVSLVARELAAEVAEELGEIQDRVLGPAFVRPAESAASVLARITRSLWYVDAAGVTHLRARPSGAASLDGARGVQRDLARRRVRLSTESIASLLPGLTLDGATISTVEHVIEDGSLSSRLSLGASP